MPNLPYTLDQLVAENQALKDEVERLRRVNEEPQQEQPETVESDDNWLDRCRPARDEYGWMI